MFTSKDKTCESLYDEFQAMIRRKRGTPEQFWSHTIDGKVPDVLVNIRDFCVNNRRQMVEELDRTEDNGVGKWMLDLTSSSLYMLLCEMGENFQSLAVYCDDSKPLTDGVLKALKVMIGRTDKPRHSIGKKESAASFNLHHEIRFASSVSTPGIQIADLMAGTLLSFFISNETWREASWKQYLPAILSNHCVLPTPANIDLDRTEVMLNVMILQELSERSRKGVPILRGIGSVIAETSAEIQEWKQQKLQRGNKKK